MIYFKLQRGFTNYNMGMTFLKLIIKVFYDSTLQIVNFFLYSI